MEGAIWSNMKIGIINKIGRVLIKNAPKICIATGVIGIGAGTVIACKKTHENVIEIEKAKENFKDKEYIPAIKRFTKIYWPTVLIIGGSIFVMVGGHYILAKRYAGLILAYKGLNESYRDYRGWIAENYGKEVDFNAKFHKDGMAVDDDQTFVIAPEDIFIPDRDLSDFAVFFGKEYSECIKTDNPDEVFNCLKATEEWANALLEDRGYVFLWEVYQNLGVDRDAPDGIGWCHGIGDNFVDLGIYSVRNGRAVNGLEPVYLLDFNHDGYILPYI